MSPTTGDFLLHDKNGEATPKFVSLAKEASVLITEGTRADPTDGEKLLSNPSAKPARRRRTPPQASS